MAMPMAVPPHEQRRALRRWRQVVNAAQDVRTVRAAYAILQEAAWPGTPLEEGKAYVLNDAFKELCLSLNPVERRGWKLIVAETLEEIEKDLLAWEQRLAANEQAAAVSR
ncbi:MAG: hypothetical protein M0Z94_11970 [Dehalococcoidales bacterium]|nr:hypothetical protein [Dehalococcoidales bacterium]